MQKVKLIEKRSALQRNRGSLKLGIIKVKKPELSVAQMLARGSVCDVGALEQRRKAQLATSLEAERRKAEASAKQRPAFV